MIRILKWTAGIAFLFILSVCVSQGVAFISERVAERQQAVIDARKSLVAQYDSLAEAYAQQIEETKKTIAAVNEASAIIRETTAIYRAMNEEAEKREAAAKAVIAKTRDFFDTGLKKNALFSVSHDGHWYCHQFLRTEDTGTIYFQVITLSWEKKEMDWLVTDVYPVERFKKGCAPGERPL